MRRGLGGFWAPECEGIVLGEEEEEAQVGIVSMLLLPGLVLQSNVVW